MNRSPARISKPKNSTDQSPIPGTSWGSQNVGPNGGQQSPPTTGPVSRTPSPPPMSKSPPAREHNPFYISSDDDESPKKKNNGFRFKSSGSEGANIPDTVHNNDDDDVDAILNGVGKGSDVFDEDLQLALQLR